jgi:ankyrin repeat protein
MPSHVTILDICAEKSFDLWESQGLLGWTPLHRAVVFGHGKDIKKLTNVMGEQASWNMVTLDLKWRPLHYAVRYGNLSTLNVPVNNITPCDWLGIVDLRG